MKTINYFLAVLSALALVSCAKEKSPNNLGKETENRITKFSASTDDATKTSLSWDAATSQMNVLWNLNDKINVNGTEFTNTTTTESNLVTFENISGITPASEYIAVYPSTATINPDGTISASIPSEQIPTAGTFQKGANVSVAKSTTTNLLFKNVLGLIRIQVASSEVYSIKISSNGGEYLAGDITISYDLDGNPSASVVANANAKSEITVKSGSDTKVPLENGAILYVAVAPQTYASGITMTFTSIDYATGAIIKESKQGTAIRKSTNSLTINPGTFKNLGFVGNRLNWLYSDVVLHSNKFSSEDDSAIRGNYIDFETGKTFYPIGAYNHCADIDMGFSYSGTNYHVFAAIASSSITYSYSLANVSTYDAGATAQELPANWATRNKTYFIEYTADEMNDAAFEALKTTANPTTGEGGTVYYNYKDNKLDSGTRRKDTINKVNEYTSGVGFNNRVKYIGFKTVQGGNTRSYGVIKVTGYSFTGLPDYSTITFDYIIGKL